MQAETTEGGVLLSLDPPDRAHVRIPATTLGVRQGLRDLVACPLLSDLDADSRGTAEIVLAEALNNIVEHAYAAYPGDIEVELQRIPGEMRVHIADTGLPMPGAVPPLGRLPAIATFDDLPEGGFGWFLIRSLAQDLAYRRDGSRNRLSFRVIVDNPA